VTLSNTGVDPVVVTVGTFPNGFSRQGGNCGASLAAASSCTIGVQFAPTEQVTYSGTVVINGLTVTLSGTGFSAPIATVTPASLAFGDVLTNTTASLDMTLSNTGNAILTGIDVGGFPAGFTRQGGTCDADLAASTTCTITVQFAPTAAQFYGGTVSITATNATITNTSVALSGIGLTAPIASITPALLAFGDAVLGSTPTLDLVLSNDGNADLTGITVGAFPDGFSRQGGTCGASLAAGVTCTITVQFVPTELIEYSGELFILSITAANATVINSPVSLSGSGVAPEGAVAAQAATFGTLNAAGDELDFGVLPNGDYPSTVTFSVTGAPVTFGAVTKTGGRYSIVASTCVDTVLVGDTCTVTISFNANGNAQRIGSLTVNHNGTNGSTVLALLGQ
jgi:hypothetical protein